MTYYYNFVPACHFEQKTVEKSFKRGNLPKMAKWRDDRITKTCPCNIQ